jgi:hypothetical protein
VRQFLALIAQRSLRYSTEMAEGFPAFMGSIDKLIAAIAQLPQPSKGIFEHAHASLVATWTQEDEAAAIAQARKETEQQQMQAAKQLAGRLGFELIGRPDAGDAPPSIKQFLMGPWAQVLAKAQLFPQREGDLPRYTQALAALLWSVSERRAAGRKKEHSELLPKLWSAIRAGLLSIQWTDAQIDEFHADLQKLQYAVQAASASMDDLLPPSDADSVLPD